MNPFLRSHLPLLPEHYPPPVTRLLRNPETITIFKITGEEDTILKKCEIVFNYLFVIF